MQDHPLLGQLILGYSPFVNRQRAVAATRLTVFPEPRDARIDGQALTTLLAEVWPDTTPVAPGAMPPVSLNVAAEGLLRELMQAPLPPQFMLEVPAFLASDPAHAADLARLHAAGNALLIKGQPAAPLPPEVLRCFSHVLLDDPGALRQAATAAGSPAGRAPSLVLAGAGTEAAVVDALARGAAAVVGWQFDDPLTASGGRQAVPPDLQLVLELMKGVERGDSLPRLEALLKRDPTLGFKLMRYLNSPAFGLKVEINSFGHALMLLGSQRLKRWLALLLVSSGKATHGKALLFAALRRGLLLEELGSRVDDPEARGELFICGIFSLIDRLLNHPFESLLGNMPVPERVQHALRGQGGPYLPYLDLARAVEQASAIDIRECAEKLFLTPDEVNRALLSALGAARQLD